MATTNPTNTYTFKAEIPAFEFKVDVPHEDFDVQAFTDEVASMLSASMSRLSEVVFQAYLSSNGPHDAVLNTAQTGEPPEATVTWMGDEFTDEINAQLAKEAAAA